MTTIGDNSGLNEAFMSQYCIEYIKRLGILLYLQFDINHIILEQF